MRSMTTNDATGVSPDVIGEKLEKNTKPQVYFRGVNRIHANRLKAYILIFSHRLDTQWAFTEDIKSANVVVEQNHSDVKEKSSLQMSVLSGTANFKPPALANYDLEFDDRKLVARLNQASKLLKQHNHNSDQGDQFSNTQADDNDLQLYKICGLLNEPLNALCNQLNDNELNIQFIPTLELTENHSNLFEKKVLLMVDVKIKESLLIYKNLLSQKRRNNIIIDQLTVVIVKSNDEARDEEVFDKIYSQCDESTQIILLDINDKNEISAFVKYL